MISYCCENFCLKQLEAKVIFFYVVFFKFSHLELSFFFSSKFVCHLLNFIGNVFLVRQASRCVRKNNMECIIIGICTLEHMSRTICL